MHELQVKVMVCVTAGESFRVTTYSDVAVVLPQPQVTMGKALLSMQAALVAPKANV